MELLETLAELEFFFPYTMCTINLHYLVHLPVQILRCGPVFVYWMYPLERDAGRLVDSIKSMKVPEESLVRSYVLCEALERERAGDPHYASSLHRRVFHRGGSQPLVAPLYLSHEAVYNLVGSCTKDNLEPNLFAELVQLWRHRDASIDSVWLRFEEDVLNGRYHGDIRDWLPADGGPPLSERELDMRFTPSSEVALFRRGYLNDTYFRAYNIDRNRVRSNCCFKTYHPVHGVLYGVLDALLLHRAFPHASAPVTVVAQVATWLKPLSPDPDTNIPMALQLYTPDPSDPLHRFAFSKFCFFDNISPFNVSTLLAHTAEDETFATHFVFEFSRFETGG